MSDLVRDYLALPEVRFLTEHWLALLVLLLASVLAVLYLDERRRP